MKTLRNTIATVALATLLLSSYAFAQNTASATAPVKISLKKGLAISNEGGSLDFGNLVVTSSDQTETITPENGAQFKVTGHPNKAVTITYSDVTLKNDTWVSDNGGVNSTLTFSSSMFQTGSNATYTSAVAIGKGGKVETLVNNNGVGTMYLWVGGDIIVSGNQAQGDYAGSLTVSVAY